MQIYIRNSKIPIPSFIKGMMTEIWSAGEMIGIVDYRHTTTHCQPPWDSSKNGWRLFNVAIFAGCDEQRIDGGAQYRIGTGDAYILGRCNGEDAGFQVERLTEPAIDLPNGFVKDAVWTPVAVEFRPHCPDSLSDVFASFSRLEFHQPGGRGSEAEEIGDEECKILFAKEYVSYQILVGKWEGDVPSEIKSWNAEKYIPAEILEERRHQLESGQAVPETVA
jgi:hypothetical protein